MRDFARILLLVLLAFGDATRPKAETDAHPFTKADEMALGWCFSHFPFGLENPWADEDAVPPDWPAELPPFDMKDMLGPPNLIKKTEIMGKLPPAIAEYQGLWIWPTASMSPPLAIFVERLTPTEMIIAMVRRELKPSSNPDPLRYRLKWNGEAFLEEPQKSDGVGYHIRISKDGKAMLVVFVTRIEAMPGFCLISSKHY